MACLPRREPIEETVPGYSAVQILIKNVNNKAIKLEVDPNCTIGKIKYLINNKEDIPVEQQIIIFKGKELQNQLDLSYYDIKNNHVLHFFNKYSDEESKHSTDELIVTEEITTSDSDTDPLAQILTNYGLYDDLYSKMIDEQIDLETLQHLAANEINGFCDDFEMNTIQKVKFRKLMSAFYKKQNPDSEMVVVLIGDCGVGKTCLMNQYVKQTYNRSSTSTIGVGYQNVVETLDDNSTMKIIIWDTAGQERFHSICRGYYRKADCIILCYDASIERPFENCERWRKDIEDYGKNELVIVLVGCKIDKIESEQKRQLNIAKAESMIEQLKWVKFNTIHFECSAKTGDNVRNVFLAAAELVLMHIPQSKENYGVVDQLQKETVQRESKCFLCN